MKQLSFIQHTYSKSAVRSGSTEVQDAEKTAPQRHFSQRVCRYVCVMLHMMCVSVHVWFVREVSGRIASVPHYHVHATVLSIDGKGHINSIAASSHVEDPLHQEFSAAWLRCRSLHQ